MSETDSQHKRDFALLQRHFEDAGVTHQLNVDERSIHAVFRGDRGTYVVLARLTSTLLQVFVHLPLAIPVGCRPDIREAARCANLGIALGAFEQDDDRLYYYGYGITASGVDEPTIHLLMTAGLALAEFFAPAFHSVVYANEPPADAIKRIRADNDHPVWKKFCK